MAGPAVVSAKVGLHGAPVTSSPAPPVMTPSASSRIRLRAWAVCWTGLIRGIGLTGGSDGSDVAGPVRVALLGPGAVTGASHVVSGAGLGSLPEFLFANGTAEHPDGGIFDQERVFPGPRGTGNWQPSVVMAATAGLLGSGGNGSTVVTVVRPGGSGDGGNGGAGVTGVTVVPGCRRDRVVRGDGGSGGARRHSGCVAGFGGAGGSGGDTACWGGAMVAAAETEGLEWRGWTGQGQRRAWQFQPD